MQTELQMINGARTQYRAMFRRMAIEGQAWHMHKGSAGVVLLRADAVSDVPLPAIVKNVHAMAEQTMVNALTAALRRAKGEAA